MEKTNRLAMPLIIAGQAQKELVHNEALQLLDTLVAGCVEEGPRNDPPAAAAVGECYIVGLSPTGAWAGYAGHIAAFTSAGWKFVAPRVGMVLRNSATQTHVSYEAAGWETGTLRVERVLVDDAQVVGGRRGAIADPAGGGVVDSEGRNAIIAILEALRQHGLIAG